MVRNGKGRRILKLVAGLTIGGSVLQLSSCDPAVRTTLLTGLEATTASLLTTVNTAFFLGLQSDNNQTDTSSLTTT